MLPPVQQIYPLLLQPPDFSSIPPVPVRPYVYPPIPPPEVPHYTSAYTPVVCPGFIPRPPDVSNIPPVPVPEVPHYTSAYTPMVRPGFIPRPPDVSYIPPVPVPGQIWPLSPPFYSVPLYPAIPPPGVRPGNVPHPPDVLDSVPSVTPVKKLRNMVYVGKIASTVGNEYILAILQLCGPVKSWRRPQDHPNSNPKSYGLCEFETAEGVRRALRLLRDFNVDGQKLTINVSEATQDVLGNYGIVSDDELETDQKILMKLADVIASRSENNQLLPPKLQASGGSNTLNLDHIAELGDSKFNVDHKRNGVNKRDEKRAYKVKPYSKQGSLDTRSPYRSRKKERTREDGKRYRQYEAKEYRQYEAKEYRQYEAKEVERYEREGGKRYRQYEAKEYRQYEAKEVERYERERKYKELVMNWGNRERNNGYERKVEKEMAKKREYYRKRKILVEERGRREVVSRSERERRRLEKEKNLADQLKDEGEIDGRDEVIPIIEEEIEEGEIIYDDSGNQNCIESLPVMRETNESDKAVMQIKAVTKDEAVEMTCDGDFGNKTHIGNDIIENGDGHKSVVSLDMLIDMIPTSKEEIFSYEINWDVCDKNELYDRMRPWIIKKVVEFMGYEESRLVNAIVSSIREHVTAVEMCDRFNWILADDTEWFVVNMLKILIYEIKKTEVGVSDAGNFMHYVD